MDAIEIIKNLLNVLPDSLHPEAKTRCWDWCWDELDDESQELVKMVRTKAEKFIK